MTTHTTACQLGKDMCAEREAEVRLEQRIHQLRIRFSALVETDFDAAQRLLKAFGVEYFDALEEDQLDPFAVAMLVGVMP